MTTVSWVQIVIIVGAVIGVAAVVGAIVRATRRTVYSAEARLFRELFNRLSSGGLNFSGEETGPKKISNMNKIYLPQLQKDFPEFNWSDTRRMIEREIKARFAEKPAFTLYETAIARYEKIGGDVTVTTESAASWKTGETTKQTVIRTELSYIRYNSDQPESGIRSLNCPNCGAPLKRNPAGELVCEYCDTAVTGQRDWQITDIREK